MMEKYTQSALYVTRQKEGNDMRLCKRDLSKECEGKYRNCADCVLDKIRTEIENHCCLTKENHCRYCSYCNSLMGVREILAIIDKYKKESEE